MGQWWIGLHAKPASHFLSRLSSLWPRVADTTKMRQCMFIFPIHLFRLGFRSCCPGSKKTQVGKSVQNQRQTSWVQLQVTKTRQERPLVELVASVIYIKTAHHKFQNTMLRAEKLRDLNFTSNKTSV